MASDLGRMGRSHGSPGCFVSLCGGKFGTLLVEGPRRSLATSRLGICLGFLVSQRETGMFQGFSSSFFDFFFAPAFSASSSGRGRTW